jgi:thiol-disulfide isomerase/thioredoxin
MLMVVFQSTSAFTATTMMTYKPPVRSSVSKLRNSRGIGGSDSSSSSSTGRISTSKQQQAATSFVSNPTEVQQQQKEDLDPSTTTFEDRMRGLVFKDKKKQPVRRRLPPNVFVVETLQDYKQIVGEESSKMVAVRFYAPWCKACKAVQPLFYHMANKFPNVVFVDVPVTDQNTNLHQGLGVQALPSGHIYHPSGGLVEELRMTRKCIPSFARKLQSYVMERCDLEDVGDVKSPYPTE